MRIACRCPTWDSATRMNSAGFSVLVAASLHAVLFVVEADADDLAWVRNDRKESHLGELQIGLLGGLRDFFGLAERASGE